MDHVNVIIVGAGLSGVGAAAHLVEQCPEKTFTLLEGRAAVGGTWDLFRYPGIRSDSDMHTLGYSFKPWTQAKSIADGPSIREYVNETADEFDIRRHIRFDHKVQTASWDSTQSRWVFNQHPIRWQHNQDIWRLFVYVRRLLQLRQTPSTRIPG